MNTEGVSGRISKSNQTMCMLDIFKFRILNFGVIVSCIQSPEFGMNGTKEVSL